MAKEKIASRDPYIVKKTFQKIIAEYNKTSRQKMAKILLKDDNNIVASTKKILNHEASLNILHMIAWGKVSPYILDTIESYITPDMYNSRSKYNNTPLMIAVSCGQVEAFKKLVEFQTRKLKSVGYTQEQIQLELKHTVNIADDRDQTALHKAADRYRIEQIKILLSLGANPMAIDENSNTTAHLAAEYPFAAKELIKLLVAAGNNPWHKNNQGQTVLDLLYNNSRLGMYEDGKGLFMWKATDTQEVIKVYRKPAHSFVEKLGSTDDNVYIGL